MITIISGTNRINSRTKLVAETFHQVLKNITDEEIHFVDLCTMNNHEIKPEYFNGETPDPALRSLQESVLIPSNKWIIMAPEYNGSYPGIIKYLIDTLSVYRRNDTFKGSNLALIGVASGRAGNLRGLDQLADIAMHLGMKVYPNKLPISSIEGFIEEGKLNSSIQELAENHLKAYLSWC